MSNEATGPMYQIMYKKPIIDLVKLCHSHATFSQLCKNPNFWAKRAQMDFKYPINDFLDYGHGLSGLDKYFIIKSELDNKKFKPISSRDNPFRVRVRLYYYHPSGIDEMLLYKLIENYTNESRDNILDIINIILDSNIPIIRNHRYSALALAAWSNYFDIVNLLLSNRQFRESKYHIESALYVIDNLDMIKFFIQSVNNINISPALRGAASSNNLEILDYLLDNFEFSLDELKYAVSSAINANSIDALIKLLENPDIIIECWSFQVAMINGQYELIKILLQYPGIDHCLNKLNYDDIKENKEFYTDRIANLVLNHPKMRIYE